VAGTQRGSDPATAALGAAAVVAALVAHDFVDHACGDACLLQPGRERVPEVVRAMELQILKQGIAQWRKRLPSGCLAVTIGSDQAGGLQLPQSHLDGHEPELATTGAEAVGHLRGMAAPGDQADLTGG
jgi:hypothetical protein